MVRKILHPLRLSTGSLISPDLYRHAPTSYKQLDLIAWDPNPYPAIFEEAGFAMVPTSSAVGVFEVKRSAYRVGKAMKETLDWVECHMVGSSGWKPYRDFSHKVTASKPILQMTQGIRMVEDPHRNALGVVCIRELSQKNAQLTRLIEDGRAVVLIEETSPGGFSVNAAHVAQLVKFIHLCKHRLKHRADVELSPELIGKGLGQTLGSLQRSPASA